MTDTNTPVDHLARAKAILADADDLHDMDFDHTVARDRAATHALVAIAEELRRLNRPPAAAPAPEDQLSRAAREWAALPSFAARSELLLLLRRMAKSATPFEEPHAFTAVLEAAINLLVAAQNGSTP